MKMGEVIESVSKLMPSLENVESSEMFVLFWAGEIFDPALPDIYDAKVPNEKA